MRRRQHLGWIFGAERAGRPRWVSGQSEGARRRAGAHPRLRQQSLEAAWREANRSEGAHQVAAVSPSRRGVSKSFTD